MIPAKTMPQSGGEMINMMISTVMMKRRARMNIETFVPSVSWTTWMSEFSRLTSKQEQNKWDEY